MSVAVLVFAATADQPNQPRAARSVHLRYDAPDSVLFYNEVVVEESVPGSYFMACGWNTGYFGIQQLRGADDKVALFSVWDPARGDNPNVVPEAQRAEVLFTGDGVQVSRFGGEGTGAKSMFPYAWKIGETNRFLVQAKVEGERTAYTASIYLNETHQWKKLATFRTHTNGAPLKDYYSFIEDFRRDGKSPNERRRARFQNGWVRTARGDWKSLTGAMFTADDTPLMNIDAAVAGNGFILATGGDTKNSSHLDTTIRRPAGALKPPDLPAEPATLLAITAKNAKGEEIITVVLDTTETPDLDDWGKQAANLCVQWYPRISELLASDGFHPPRKVRLNFKKDMGGVAATSGDVINVSANFVRGHRDDFGMVIHELTHVVQSYPGGGPGWLVEGIADYIRQTHFEPQVAVPKINPDKASYRDSYKTAAAFLAWIEKTRDKQIVPKLNRALREKTFKMELFKEYTGQTVDELWEGFTQSLRNK